MFSTTVVTLVLSVYAVEIIAVDVIPNNNNLIENCCDLGFRQIAFSEIINKRKIYRFKTFAIIIDHHPPVDIVTQ